MLGKLIKTDLKSTARMFLPLCAAMIVLAVAMLICSSVMPDNDLGNTTTSVAYMLYYLTQFVFSLLALVIPIARFRSSIMKDEAYLMLSIPIRPWMHIVSKLVCTLVWYFIAQVCRTLVVMLSTLFDKETSFSGLFELFSGKQNDAVSSVILSFVMLFVFIVCSQLFVYFVSVLAGMSAKHRRALSVGFFIGGSTLITWGASVFIMIATQLSHRSLDSVFGTVNYVMMLMLIYFGVLSVILFIVTALILNKKYDLIS